MRRPGIALPLLLLAILATVVTSPVEQAGAAKRKLTKREARLAAEVAAYDFALRRPDLTSAKVGACHRLSRTRFRCEGEASGEDFNCESVAPYGCFSTLTTCELTVDAHAAGFTALGRVRNPRCKKVVREV